MAEYAELIKALRERALRENEWYEHGGDIIKAAAAAIEALQAELERKLTANCWGCKCEKLEPKRGEWVRVEDGESYHYECSECGERPLYSRYGDVVLSRVCPMCGAKMEVQE